MQPITHTQPKKPQSQQKGSENNIVRLVSGIAAFCFGVYISVKYIKRFVCTCQNKTLVRIAFENGFHNLAGIVCRIRLRTATFFQITDINKGLVSEALKSHDVGYVAFLESHLSEMYKTCNFTPFEKKELYESILSSNDYRFIGSCEKVVGGIKTIEQEGFHPLHFAVEKGFLCSYHHLHSDDTNATNYNTFDDNGRHIMFNAIKSRNLNIVIEVESKFYFSDVDWPNISHKPTQPNAIYKPKTLIQEAALAGNTEVFDHIYNLVYNKTYPYADIAAIFAFGIQSGSQEMVKHLHKIISNRLNEIRERSEEDLINSIRIFMHDLNVCFLERAAMSSSKSMVEYVIKHYYKEKYKQGVTEDEYKNLLLYSVISGSTELVDWVFKTLEKKGIVFKKGYLDTPLRRSLSAGNMDIHKDIYKRCKKLEKQDKKYIDWQFAPDFLSGAICSGKLDLVKSIFDKYESIAKEANPELYASYKPWYFAAALGLGNHDIIDYLLRKEYPRKKFSRRSKEFPNRG